MARKPFLEEIFNACSLEDSKTSGTPPSELEDTKRLVSCVNEYSLFPNLECSLEHFMLKVPELLKEMQKSLERITDTKKQFYRNYKTCEVKNIIKDLGETRETILNDVSENLEFILRQHMAIDELCKLFQNLLVAYGSTDVSTFEQDLLIVRKIYSEIKNSLTQMNPDYVLRTMLSGKTVQLSIKDVSVELKSFEAACEFSKWVLSKDVHLKSRVDQCANFNSMSMNLLQVLKSTLASFINDNEITLGKDTSNTIKNVPLIKVETPELLNKELLKLEFDTNTLLNRLTELLFETTQKTSPKVRDFISYAYNTLTLLSTSLEKGSSQTESDSASKN